MFQERVRRLLQMIRDLLAELETEVERLELDAITDSLTGVHNRRFFDLRLAEEFERVRRYGRTMALVLIDLDDFKEFNDRFGHRRGDQLLVELARTISSAVREPDVVCRYGGEEFALILPETDEQGAVRLVLRLRDRVRQHVSYPMSFSAGVAVGSRDAGDPMDLLDAADRALYTAKASGKAAVATASGQLFRMGGRTPVGGVGAPVPGPRDRVPADPVGGVLEALSLALLDVPASGSGTEPPADRTEPGEEGERPEPPVPDGAGPSASAGEPPAGDPTAVHAPEGDGRDHPLWPEDGSADAERPVRLEDAAGSAASEPGAAADPGPAAGTLPGRGPVGLGFAPSDRLPRAVWFGTRVLPVQSAEALPGRAGYRVLTPEGIFTIVRDDVGRWVAVAGMRPPRESGPPAR